MAVRIWTGKDTKTDTGPEHFEVTWEGAVLALREMNGPDDSDFYAVVWDAAAGAPRDVYYATTRGWTYYNSAAVDATPDVRAAYDAWHAVRRIEYEAAAAEAEAAAAEAEARVPRPGRHVRVVKGRKVPVGTEGTVFWAGNAGYGQRVGFTTAQGVKHFTAASNVEVVAAELAAAR